MNDNELLTVQADVFKALAHPSRLAMIRMLSSGERCVCELQAEVGSDMSTVSKHLSVLKNAGIVSDQKRGMNVYYTLKADCVIGFMECIEGMAERGPTGTTVLAKSCCSIKRRKHGKK